jgi:peptidoglycan/LPS O-acetylase OafA/YrhL
LVVEITFYVVIFVLLMVRRFGSIGRVMGLIGLLSCAFWIAEAVGVQVRLPLAPHNADRLGQLSLAYYGVFFGLGVFLWLTLLKKVTWTRVLIVGCFTVGGLLSIWLAYPNFLSVRLSACTVWLLSIAAICGSVKLNGMLLRRPVIAVGARILGLTTYPLYLLHDIVGAALIGWLIRSGIGQYTALALSVSTVMLLAGLIATIVEPAVQNWLKSLIDSFGRRFDAGRASASYFRA